MKLVIAGGGTGGHIFAGIAVADALMKKDSTSDVLFIGSNYGMEKKIFSEYKYKFELLNIRGIKGKGVLGLIKGCALIPLSMLKAFSLLLKFKPDAVLGVGGYSSGPVLIVAAMMGIKTGIIEQNSVPGLTNRILSKFVRKVFTVFAYSEKWFNPKKIKRTGNPCRENIAKIAQLKKANLQANGLACDSENVNKSFTVFVIGGSQGARKLNEIVCGAHEILKNKITGFKVIHQVGARDFDRMKEMYKGEMSESFEVHAFISDMASMYAKSDLIVSRSGVGTLVEIAAARKTSILIPFPFASDNHQEKNAIEIAQNGGAIWKKESELSAENLAQIINDLYVDTSKRNDISNKVANFYNENAALEIIENINV